MNIIIYHGKQATGKTTQLTVETIRFADSFKEAGQIVANRQILENENGKFLFWDEFTMKDLPKINHKEIDWLYLGCQECPKFEEIERFFKGYAKVYDIRETMFPYCHYINIDNGLHTAFYGGFYVQHENKEDLLIEITAEPRTKEIPIPNISELLNFLEENSEPPTNFSEWGLDYAYLMNFKNKLKSITGNTIIVSGNEACAIANYNAGKMQWIEDLFFNLFDKA